MNSILKTLKPTESPEMVLPRLVILDVAHGNCSVLFDSEGVVVIDAGPGTSLLEFLEEQNVVRVEALLISHADKDHIEGVIALLASGRVDVGLVKLNSDALKGSELWDDLVYELYQANLRGKLLFEVSLTPNDTGKLDFGMIHIEILAPSLYLAAKGPGAKDRDGIAISTNSMSAVVRLLNGDTPIALIAGDIDELGLKHLLESGLNLNAFLLIFPHHGGKSGINNLELFAKQLTEQVVPEIVVFSIGRSGKFMNPQPEVVIGVRKGRPTARILCTQLSRNCAASIPLNAPSHLNSIFSRGREARICCSGSIVVDIKDSGIRVFPDVASHQGFIVDNAPTAMCKDW